MKMNTHQLNIIILLTFIIILIIFLFYSYRKFSLQNDILKREGFISKFYRPYFRTLKRGLSGYFNYFLKF